MEAERILAEVDEADEANLPQRLPGAGLSGVTNHVSAEETRARRRLMSEALVQGISKDTIVETFMAKYSMTEEAVHRLIADTRATWAEEDSEDSRYDRPMQKRRLLGHIREASKDRKWTAVANLEGELARIIGTDRHEEDTPDVNERLSGAVMHILGVTDQKTLRLMIESHRDFLALGSAEGPTPEMFIDTEAETVDEPPPPKKKSRPRKKKVAEK